MKFLMKMKSLISVTLLCIIVGGVKLQILRKSAQVHLIIIRKWPKNNPLILRNLNNFPPYGFYLTPHPPSPSPTIRHKRVYSTERLYFVWKHPLLCYCFHYDQFICLWSFYLLYSVFLQRGICWQYLFIDNFSVFSPFVTNDNWQVWSWFFSTVYILSPSIQGWTKKICGRQP